MVLPAEVQQAVRPSTGVATIVAITRDSGSVAWGPACPGASVSFARYPARPWCQRVPRPGPSDQPIATAAMLSEQVWEPLPYQPCDLPQVTYHLYH